MKKASDFHKEGYNCAESIIKSVNEKRNLQIPVSVASSMGRGMNVGSTCGAVLGGVIAIGYLKGRDSIDEENEAKAYTKEFINAVREHYKQEDCIYLKKNGINCTNIIDFVDEYLDTIK